MCLWYNVKNLKNTIKTSSLNRIYFGEAERINVTEAEFEGCMKRICQGDQMGLKDIYVEYLPYIYRVIYGIVGNNQNAVAITSEFFVKQWSIAPY